MVKPKTRGCGVEALWGRRCARLPFLPTREVLPQRGHRLRPPSLSPRHRSSKPNACDERCLGLRDGGRRRCPRWGSTSRVGRKGRRAHLRPQRASTPHPLVFGLTMRFAAGRRGRRGHHDRPPSQPVGEGHAPVVAVLLAASQRRAARPAPERSRKHGNPGGPRARLRLRAETAAADAATGAPAFPWAGRRASALKGGGVGGGVGGVVGGGGGGGGGVGG